MSNATPAADDTPANAASGLSIRSLMFLLVLVVLLPATGVVAWFLAAQKEQARAGAEAEVRQLANGTLTALQLILGDQQAVMQLLAERPRVRALNADDVDPGVAEYVQLHREFNTLTVRDREARPVFSSRPNPNTPEQFGAFPWFKEGITSGGFLASDAFQGTLTKRWVTVLTQPVRDERGEVVGLMSLSQDLLALNQRVLGSVPANAVVAVTDRQDRYLLRSAEPEAWLGKPGPSKVVQDTQGQREGFLSATGPDGITRLYAFVTMADTGWRVVAGLPQDQVFAASRALFQRSALFGVGIMLLALLAAWRVGRRISGPIDALSRSAVKVATGDYRARAPEQGPAEIRAVAQEFNRMVQARNQSEQTLRQRDHALAEVSQGVMMTDAQAHITYVNPGFMRLTGYTEAEVLGRTASFLQGEGSLPATVDEVSRAVHAGNGFHGEILNYRKNGSAMWIALDISPLRDEQGVLTGFVGAQRDVTDRKQAAAAQRELESQLRESQKMESIGTLAGGIAHDFNNILAAILGNLALAREDIGPGHPAQQSLEQLSNASLRARHLVQQILAFSRRQPHELVVQPLNPIVQETLALLRSTLPAMIELQVDLPAAPIHVSTDATQMQQVLMNLCTNAWHALPGDAGRIEVGLDEQVLDASAARALGELPAGRYAHLWVKDTGVGMDAPTRKRVFEPFFTTKAVGAGTGLGMSVVHGIVKAQHGGISVSSAVGKGTTVDLYFPVCEPAEPIDTDAGGAAAEAEQSHGENVLYVDDDDVVRLVVERLLERAGLRVAAMASVSDALNALRAAPAAFDLVVTDFNMPGSSGLELASEVARLRPDLPIVIASGYVSDELRRGAAAAGVRHLLQKQNLIEELVPLVRRVLFESGVAARE